MDDESEKTPEIGILLIGATGTGKSTFIASLTGQHDLIGNTLESHTSQSQRFYVGAGRGKFIHVVDSPGFDDTNRSDTEVLGEIVQSLHELSQSRIAIQGVIYLQRISDPRVSGGTWKSLRMLECICGKRAFGNIILVSTMWDRLRRVPEGHKIGRSYENNLYLRKDFWGDLVNGGAFITRLRTPRGLSPSWNAGASPWDIVMSLAEKEPVDSLQILRELDDGNQTVRLQDTEAGRYLEQDIQQLQEEYEKKLNMLLKDLEETRNQGDAEMEKLYSDEADHYLLKLDKAKSDLNQLRANLSRQPELETLGLERRDSLRFPTAAADNGEQGSDSAHLQNMNIGNHTEIQMETQTLNITQNPNSKQNQNSDKNQNQTQTQTQAQIDKSKPKSRSFRKYF